MRDYGTLVIDEEDIYDMHKPLRLGEGLRNDDIAKSLDIHITFSFANADIGTTDYGFNQHFTDRDTFRIFKLLKMFSGYTLKEMLCQEDNEDDEGERLHLNRSNIKGNLKKAFEKLGKKVDESNSLVYHFALYTNKSGNADRAKDTRSPRVYFMVGQFGIMHILFIDFFHEINPSDY